MQIRMFVCNGTGAVSSAGIQSKKSAGQVSRDVFGASCSVTISSEGRKRSGQLQAAGNIRREVKLLRKQEQTSDYDKLKNEYMELLKADGTNIKSVKNSYVAKSDDETALKKRQLIEQMRKQKEEQLEKNQQNEEEARKLAMQSCEFQQDIDDNNRDLLIMLESMREAEKNDERRENGGKSEDVQSQNKERDMGEQIKNAAARFGAESIGRESDVLGMIGTLNNDGHSYIAKANEIVNCFCDSLEGLNGVLASDNISEEEKYQEVLNYHQRAMTGCGEMQIYRERGLQMIKDARDAKIKHIADNPLKGVEETKENMMMYASDMTLKDAMNSKLDEFSDELKSAVKELIDERNNIDTPKTDYDENDTKINEDESEEMPDEEETA